MCIRDRSYAEQLKIKTDQVKKLLAPYGSVDEIIGMKEPYHYRNKVNAAFQHKRNGEILAGVYEEGTHRVLSVDDCKIENRRAQEIVETIRGLLRSFKITVYNEDSGYGLLRHVMVRTGHATGEVDVYKRQVQRRWHTALMGQMHRRFRCVRRYFAQVVRIAHRSMQ